MPLNSSATGTSSATQSSASKNMSCRKPRTGRFWAPQPKSSSWLQTGTGICLVGQARGVLGANNCCNPGAKPGNSMKTSVPSDMSAHAATKKNKVRVQMHQSNSVQAGSARCRNGPTCVVGSRRRVNTGMRKFKLRHFASPDPSDQPVATPMTNTSRSHCHLHS